MPDLATFVSLHPFLSGATLIVFVLLLFVELLRAKRNVFRLNPTQATQLINHNNAVVIDIRLSEAYKNGHIIDAKLVSTDEIKKQPKKIEKYKNKPLIFVCDTGLESQKIATSLSKLGYQAYSLSGGMRAWSAAQMPIVKE